MKNRIIIFLFFLFAMALTFADTLYIGNKDTVILRDNPSPQANVVKELSKDTPVDLLKTNLKNGYSYVQTGKGDKGWVQTDFLVSSVTPKKEEHSFLSFLQFWKHPAVAKPTATINAINQKTRNDQQDNILQAQAAMQAQLDQLQTQVTALQQNSAHWSWFIWGIVAAFFCFLLGYFWGALRARRQKRWFS